MGSLRLHSSQFLFLALAVVVNAFFIAPPLAGEEFDWRNVNGQNWLPEVRDQFLGTCWAHAAAGVLESKYMLTRDDADYRPDVSEQQIVWGADGDSDGGKAADALNYITSAGLLLDSELPYNPSSPDNGTIPSGSGNRRFKSTSNFNEMAEDTNLATIKNYLKTCGPLTLRCEVDNDWYSPAPSGNRGNHAVVIVGFHDNLPGENAPGGGYWIIRNSWGADWNGDGYGAIAYATRPTYEDDDIWHLWQDNVNVCGITSPAVFTGSMATVSWNGGSGTWSSGASNFSGVDMYGNSLPTYAWENKETSVTFNASSGTEIAINGKVIAHGLTISAGATGYVFNGVNNGILTVTGGGINANEYVTINTSVKIGAPQTWNVASGKGLTIGGNVHTIISGLTVSGPGWTEIKGSINGGGAANMAGAAAGAITISGGADLYLTGNGTFYDVNTNVASGRLFFMPSAGAASNYRGVISGSGYIDKYGAGTAILSGANTFSNWLSIYEGAIQADSGVGLPTNTFLNLDGGVIQSNGTTTFTRSLGTNGANKFQWRTGGGGFAAGAGPMTVNIGGSGATVNWGNSVGDSIMGTLKFGSLTAASVTTFVNGINLNGNDRTIYVEDNPSSNDDIAVISGNIVDISGPYWANLFKTGPGTLKLTGANAYGDNVGSGSTFVQGGALQADRGVGLPWTSVLELSGGVLQSNSEITFADVFWNDTPNANAVSWNSGGFSAGGGKMTVNLYGDQRTINWGTDAHNSIVGEMVLSSTSAQFETEVQNGLNLNGASRVIRVDENPFSTGDFARISGNIVDTAGNNLGGIEKTGAGRLILTGTNTYGDPTGYNAYTIITQGVLQADRGAGLPANSGLVLNGGVLQSNSEVTFSDPLWYWAPDGHEITWNDGGFSAGGGKMAVNLFGDKRTLNWGTNGTQGIAGTMKLSSASAQFETDIQNGINLAGGGRTVQVEDNPASGGDFATLSGAISDSVGGASLTKTGTGTLRISGAAGNTYTGATYLQGGNVDLAKSSGAAIPGNLYLGGDSSYFVSLLGNNQIAPTGSLIWNSTAGWQEIKLLGRSVTVAGISDTSGRGVIENTWDETGYGTAVLTVNNSTDCSFNGFLRNQAFSGNTPLRLVKNGAGSLTLSGDNIIYSGGTTVSGGKLVLHDVTNASFLTYGISVAANGTLALNALNTDVNFAGAISGPGSVHLTAADQHPLTISGVASNTCNGTTTIAGGTIILAKTGASKAISGNILISEREGGSSTHLQLNGDNQIASSSVVTFSTPIGYSHLDLNGHSQTLAGINSDPWAAIEGLWDNTGLNADSTLTINNSVESTFQGIMRNAAQGSGAGRLKLVKSGGATLILTNNDNSFTGGTTVSGGTLQIGDGNNYGVLPATGGVVLYSGGTLYFNRNDAYSFGGTITGSGTVKIYQGASGSSFGAGYNTSLAGFSGITNVLSGAAYLRSVNGMGTGGYNLGNGASLLLWTPSTTNFSNAITLNGIGGTNNGYAKPALYGDGGSGTYTLSGQITLNATSDVGNYFGNGMMTLSGKFTGPGGLVLGKLAPSMADETGPITLSGASANDYAGGTTINRGTVYLAKTGGVAAIPGNLTINTSTSAASGNTVVKLGGSNEIATSATVTFSGVYGSQRAYLELMGNNQTLAGINDATSAGVIENSEAETGINSTGTLTINNTTDCSFNGYLRNGAFAANGASTGLLALVKSGSGKLTLSGANCSNFTGGLTVSGGTLDFSGAIWLPGSPAQFNGDNGATGPTPPASLTPCPYTISGGTLNIGSLPASIGAFHLTGGTVTGTGTLTSNAAYDIQSGTVSTGLAGAVGLTKTSADTATLSGTKANSYSGGTTISNGKLILAKPNGILAIPGNVTINTPFSANSYLVLNAAGQIPSTATMTFAPNSTAYAYFELYGKPQTLAAIFDTTGRGVIENSESESGLATGGTLIINNNIADCGFNGYIRNYISGSTGLLSLVKTGTKTLTLSGANCGGFSGGLTVNAGTLDYSGGTLPGVANGTYCFYTINGGTLQIGAGSQTIGSFRLNGGTVAGNGTLTSINDFDIRSGSVSAVLAGAVGLNKTLSGSATISARPSYTGTTTVSLGTLNFTGGLPGGNYVVSGGTLNINALSGLIGSFQLADGAVNGVGTLTSNARYDIQAGVVEVKLAGNQGLLKTGDGIATLSGVNTYSGTTRIDGGTLSLANGGRIDPFSPVDNNAVFVILDGTHSICEITGGGSTLIGNSVYLSTASILQNSLTIGGDYSGLVAHFAQSNTQNAPVPEPGTIVLLLSCGVALVVRGFRRGR